MEESKAIVSGDQTNDTIMTSNRAVHLLTTGVALASIHGLTLIFILCCLIYTSSEPMIKERNQGLPWSSGEESTL